MMTDATSHPFLGSTPYTLSAAQHQKISQDIPRHHGEVLDSDKGKHWYKNNTDYCTQKRLLMATLKKTACAQNASSMHTAQEQSSSREKYNRSKGLAQTRIPRKEHMQQIRKES